MRVLVVVTRAPHPRGKGDAKVAHECIQALRLDGNEVTVVHGSGGWSRRRALWAALTVPFSRRPAQLPLTRSAGLCRRVRAAIALQPDLVIAVHARAAQHVPRSWWPRCVLVLVDAFGRNYHTYRGRVPAALDLIYRVEAGRMTRYETLASRRFARVGVVSAADAGHLRAGSEAPERIVHLPQVVDADYFSATGRTRPPSPRFSFIGRLNYLPNRQAAAWLVGEFWPRLRDAWPEARLCIAGADPPERLSARLRAGGAEVIPNPADIRPILEASTAVIIPVSMGGGVQNKMLEAMAARVPVVATPFSKQGIGAEAGEHLLLATTPDEFVRECARLVADPELADSMARRAQEWVRAHHSISNLRQALVATCQELSHEPAGVSAGEDLLPAARARTSITQ